MLQKSRLQAHLLAQNSGPVSSLSMIKTTIFWVKIPLVRQLLIYVTLSLSSLGEISCCCPQSKHNARERDRDSTMAELVCVCVVAWQGAKVHIHQRHVWTEYTYVPRTTLRQVGSRILLCITVVFSICASIP